MLVAVGSGIVSFLAPCTIPLLPAYVGVLSGSSAGVPPDEQGGRLVRGSLPYSRSGVTGALMLGLGRALGETIAVALVLSLAPTTSFHILDANIGGNTIAANIAAQYQAAEPLGQQALIASGLVLFVITFAVNGLARYVVARGGRRTGTA